MQIFTSFWRNFVGSLAWPLAVIDKIPTCCCKNLGLLSKRSWRSQLTSNSTFSIRGPSQCLLTSCSGSPGMLMKEDFSMLSVLIHGIVWWVSGSGVSSDIVAISVWMLKLFYLSSLWATSTCKPAEGGQVWWKCLIRESLDLTKPELLQKG